VVSKSILVVEPDEALLKTISEQVLQPYGFKPLLARDQEQGLKIALTESPALLLFHLSLDSSVQLLHNLAQRDCLIPTILIIEQKLTQVTVESLRLGVRDYVVYPFAAEDVLQAIHRVLRREPDAPNYQRLAEGLDRINRELEQRLNEFDTLFKIGQSVNSLLDLEAVLNRVTEAAVFITGAEEGYLLLLDEEASELRMRAAQNLGGKDTQYDFSLPVSDSIAGKVVRSGKPILLSGDDKQSFKIKTGYLVKSLLNVPLKVGKRVIGVLGVDNQISTTPFTSAHLKQLSALADMAATALENARQHTEMHQKLTRYARESTTLQAIADQLSVVTDFDMRAQLALSLLVNTVNAEAGVLTWVADDCKHSPLYISQGTLGELALNGHHETNSAHWWNDQALQEVLRTGQPILKNKFGGNGNGNRSSHTHSQLAVPMRRGKQVIGVINLESSLSHVFTQNDLHFVSSVASQVAMALEGTMLRERAERDRDCLLLLMSAVDNAVWLIDTNLKVVAQNEVASEMVGWSPSEAVGHSVRDLLPSNNHLSHRLCQLFSQAMEERRPVSFDQSVLSTKENQSIFAGGKVVPVVRADQVVGAFCILKNVSTEKSNIRLEFANMASHLLRTPLSFIQTSIELLMNSNLDFEEQQLTLNRMWEGSQRLTEFTDELLDMLRLETEEVYVYIEPVALFPLIERVLDLVRYEKPFHHFNLVGSDTLPMVAADPIKTELILFNLLTNAVSRCPKGGCITIEPETCTSEVNISITDDGEAIPAKLLDRVFGQFYPVDDENGKMPSTYELGLYTTKRLVELQNGRIWAKSQPEQGSQFGFSLPIWERER
jgi:PAS domain S-box-containing protein